MTVTLSFRQQNRLIRLGAVGAVLMMIGGMIAMGNIDERLETTKHAYMFFMVGVDLVVAATYRMASKVTTRIVAVGVGLVFTLLPVVLGVIDMITAA